VVPGVEPRLRYQLTIIGTRGWRARVVKEIAHDHFTIQTDVPRVKVSWQVTGIRHDPYANAHRIQVVVPKTGTDAGKYEYPQLYGQPASKGVTALPPALRYSKQATTAPKLKTK
jgi:trimeric autotransporter adhesin